MSSSPLKWHGGKSYLAKKIVALFPPHLHYVETYAGGLSVLLARDPNQDCSEVVNDIDGDLMDFWRTLRSPTDFEGLVRYLEATPFSQEEWEQSGAIRDNTHTLHGRISRAARVFIRCRQSLAGRMDTFAPLSRTRTRRGMNEQASAWLSAIEGLPTVHERLKGVVILSDDALKVISQQDGEKTLFYLDPPYYPTTRTAKEVYRHEMTTNEHETLLRELAIIKGKFILSGYPSRRYDEVAAYYDWHRVDFKVPNNAAGGKTKRRMVECVWMNFEP